MTRQTANHFADKRVTITHDNFISYLDALHPRKTEFQTLELGNRDGNGRSAKHEMEVEFRQLGQPMLLSRSKPDDHYVVSPFYGRNVTQTKTMVAKRTLGVGNRARILPSANSRTPVGCSTAASKSGSCVEKR